MIKRWQGASIVMAVLAVNLAYAEAGEDKPVATVADQQVTAETEKERVTVVAIATSKSTGEEIEQALDRGERLFLLQAEDGYWYPVGATRNRLLESFPPQIEVFKLLGGQRTTVKTPELAILDSDLLEESQVELVQGKRWKTQKSAIWGSAGLLLPVGKKAPVWKRVEWSEVRFKLTVNREK